MSTSRIEWTDSTWNPIVGCTRCSPACDHCYAVRMAHRLGSNPYTPQYKGLTRMTPDGPDWTGEVRCLESEMKRPLKWRKPRKIFVGSMTDLFHPNVPFEFLDRIFAVMSLCPQHTFQVLTKRPERMREYMERGNRGQLEALSKEVGAKQGYLPWPLPNVWLGTTIWDQDSLERNMPILLSTPAAKRFVSVEPMLGPVDFSVLRHGGDHDLPVFGTEWGPNWVICGGETGPGARPMHPDWVRAMRDQCQAAGVPFFFKSWGDWAPCRLQHIDIASAVNRTNGRYHWELDPECKGDMRRVGKKAAGNVIDGRAWEQFPEVNRG